MGLGLPSTAAACYCKIYAAPVGLGSKLPMDLKSKLRAWRFF